MEQLPKADIQPVDRENMSIILPIQGYHLQKKIDEDDPEQDLFIPVPDQMVWIDGILKHVI